MITRKALRQLLDGAQKAEDEGPCFCVDEDCEEDHEDPSLFPSHCITFVTPDGRLDTAENKAYLSSRGWGVEGSLEYVVDHPRSYPEDAPRMVIVDRETREWCPATAYL